MTISGAALPRVLHLIPSFTGGGAERQLVYLATAQAELGHDVHIGYVHDGVNGRLLADTGVNLHRLAARGNHDPLLYFRVARLVRTVRPAVVQTWLTQMDVLGGLVAQRLRVPWILSERASALAYPNSWKNRLRRWVAGSAGAIVANSAVGLQYWCDVPEPRRKVIGNVVPIQLIDAAVPVSLSSVDRLADAEELIVAAGRFDPAKNWFVLIEALAAVLARRAGAHVVIFGDGYLREEVVAAVAAVNTDRIHLMGYVDDLWSWLKSASVYVSSSIFEGAPNVLLEALACHCPVVVSDIPSHRELLAESDVEFVPVASPAGFAAAIERTLGMQADDVSRRQGTFQMAQQAAPELIARRYLDLYRNLVSRALIGSDSPAGGHEPGV